MKNEKMFELVGLADDELVLEAAQQKPRIKHKKHVSVAMIAAAAAIAMSVTAGAAVVANRIKNRDDVNVYYSENMTSKLEDGGYAVDMVSQNQHFRFTLNTWVVDEFMADGVLTVEPLDDAGQAIIDKIKSFGEYETIAPLIYDRSGELVTDRNGLVGLMNSGSSNRDARSFMLKLYPDTEGLDLKKSGYDLTVCFREFTKYFAEDMGKQPYDEPDLFEGISFDLSFKPNVDCATLKAPSGHTMKLSQISYSAEVNTLDYDTGSGYSYPEEMCFYYSDGTAARLKLTDQLTRADGEFDIYVCDATQIDGGFLDDIIRIDGLESVDFAGETYKVQ